MDGVFGVEVFPFPFPASGVTGSTSVTCVRCVSGYAGGTGVS